MVDPDPDPDAPQDSLTGSLLIAMPGIDDPRFERAVIFVCAHGDDHAMGLTLNRPLDGLTVGQLLERLGVDGDGGDPAEQPVLFGGPVERERGFVLHTSDYESEQGTISVSEGVSLTATRDVLQAMATEGQRPRRALLALGYAGWGPGQLERELKENVWLTCPPDESLLFGDDHDHKWAHALAKIGVSAGSLSSLSGSA